MVRTRREKTVPIKDPTPERVRRLITIFQNFLDDKISIADLKGVSRDKMYRLADAGYVKLVHGRLDEAEDIFKALMILDHRNPYVHAVMGTIHQKRGRLVEAIMEYSRALQMDKGDVASYVNRGEIYLLTKKFRRAAADFREAILLDPYGLNNWANRARSLVIALKRNIDKVRNQKKR
jgi:tetratricopeptide (TPR) repeat protein